MAIKALVNETIAALATPPGLSGLAVLRLAGPKALSILSLFTNNLELKPRYAHHCRLFNPENKEILDDVILTWFKAPHSYSGDNLVEISCHGGFQSPKRILKALISQGARMALPGEFTRRAFINGKLDLLQVESVADIIHGNSRRSHDLAERNLKGELSHKIKTIKKTLIDLASIIELELDFSDQDIEKSSSQNLSDILNKTLYEISSLLNTFDSGKLHREGITLAIMGRPNAGKSSFLNAVLKENRAIISDIPGTTRDTIEESFIHNDLLFNIIDTAGLRDSANEIEQAGIEKSYLSLEKADFLLLIIDSNIESHYTIEHQLLKHTSLPAIILFNKIDKWNNVDKKRILKTIFKNIPSYFLSSKNSRDVVNFLDYLSNELNKKYNLFSDGVSLSRQRHFDSLFQVQKDLQVAISALNDGISHDLISLDVRSAISHLDDLSGETRSEDILNNIFSQFCIGK